MKVLVLGLLMIVATLGESSHYEYAAIDFSSHDSILGISKPNSMPLICDGPYKELTLSSTRLAAVLSKHEDYRAYEDKSLWNGQSANFCGAILTDAKLDGSVFLGVDLSGAHLNKASLRNTKFVESDLRQAVLFEANLSHASFFHVNLNAADLEGVNLNGAHITSSNLTGADLSETNLIDASISWTNLSEANLYKANLKGSSLVATTLIGTRLREASLIDGDLRAADLTGADFDQTDLTGANLEGADLTDLRFRPKNGLPVITGMAFARNLRLMHPEENSRPMLSELRDAFKKAGFRQAERDMTYLLKGLDEDRAIQEKSFLEFAFNRVAFRWTCDYGASPGRPLWVLFWMFVLLSLIYLYALTRSGMGALWAVWSPDRVQQAEGQKEPVRLSFAQPFPPDGDGIQGAKLPAYLAAPRPSPAAPRGLARIRGAVARFFGAWRLALYFSLLSAFHFGWRDLNVGNWIARIQPREYVIRATGWVRVVSGLQSLISVYLIALWVLSYFGRPFDN